MESKVQLQLQTKQQVRVYITAASLLLLLVIAPVEGDRPKNARRLGQPATPQGSFKSPCGSAEDVSVRVGRCLDEIFDLIYGRFGEAKNDQDMVIHCEKFAKTEKCVRLVAKDCLSGLHKTATSAVASATKRFHKQECKTPASRARYVEPLKCAIKKGKEMVEVYNNHTGIMQGIRDLPIAPEEKLIKMCCVLNSLDRELETRFDRECPKSTPIVMMLVHAMSDDARSTLCHSPKCGRALDGVSRTVYKPPQNFIEPVAQILYQLNTE